MSNQLTEPSLRQFALTLIANPQQTQLTSIALIDMMNQDGDMGEEIVFYSKIVNEILHGDIDTISNDEIALFIAMHEELIKIYQQD